MKIPKALVVDRVQWITNLTRGKKVLHIGCCDWPYTVEKARKNSLLHQRLIESAAKIVGIDSSEEGLEAMHLVGIENLYNCITQEREVAEILHSENFDYILFGEVLEHIPDPLSVIKQYMVAANKGAKLVITVPNFACIKKMPRLLWRNEEVHPDHCFYYSFSTMSCLLGHASLTITQVCTYWRDVKIVSKIVNSLLRHLSFMNYFADGLCFLAEKTPRKPPVSIESISK